MSTHPSQNRYTDNQLCDQLRALATGETPPTQRELREAPDTAHPDTLINRFGSWPAAVREAGLRPMRVSDPEGTHPDELRQPQAVFLYRHAHELDPWPAEEPFGMSERVKKDPEYAHLDVSSQTKRNLRSHCIVVEAGRIYTSSDTRLLYEATADTQAIREYIERTLERRRGNTPVPNCIHTGVRNLGGGRYTCCDDDCTNTCEKEDLRL